MTLQESLQKVAKHQDLIGKKLDGSIITHLVIMPANRQNESDILGCIYDGKPTNQFLAPHEDFVIVVLFDLYDASVVGTAQKQDLNLVLQQFHR